MQKYIVMLSLETVLRHFCTLVLLLDDLVVVLQD